MSANNTCVDLQLITYDSEYKMNQRKQEGLLYTVSFLTIFLVFALIITSAFEYSAPLASSHINLKVAVLQRELCKLLMEKTSVLI